MDEITVFNTHCCGEIGDVVTGIKGLKFNSPEEASSGELNFKPLIPVTTSPISPQQCVLNTVISSMWNY